MREVPFKTVLLVMGLLFLVGVSITLVLANFFPTFYRSNYAIIGVPGTPIIFAVIYFTFWFLAMVYSLVRYFMQDRFQLKEQTSLQSQNISGSSRFVKLQVIVVGIEITLLGLIFFPYALLFIPGGAAFFLLLQYLTPLLALFGIILASLKFNKKDKRMWFYYAVSVLLIWQWYKMFFRFL